MKIILGAALLCGLMSAAHAWDKIGHEAIGSVAYQHLTPVARANLDKILRSHPGLLDGSTSDVDFKTLAGASTWPDAIRKSKLDRPTWHYIDIPFNLDGQLGPDPAEANAVSTLPKQVAIVASNAPDADKAIAISWIAHLIEDIHQPLHCTSLFDNDHLPPFGDKGGNGFIYLGPNGEERRLHGYWDAALELGNSPDPAQIAKQIEATPLFLDTMKPAERSDYATPGIYMNLAQESFLIACNEVYRRSSGANAPLLNRRTAEPLPADYPQRALSIARSQAKRAAVRLAAFLTRC